MYLFFIIFCCYISSFIYIVFPFTGSHAVQETISSRRHNSDDSSATISADEADEPLGQKMYLKRRDSFRIGTHHPHPAGQSARINLRPSSPEANSSSTAACVRDLIHSAIERNLDKPMGLPEDFRRRLESAGLAAERAGEEEKRTTRDDGIGRYPQLNRMSLLNPMPQNRSVTVHKHVFLQRK